MIFGKRGLCESKALFYIPIFMKGGENNVHQQST